MHSGAQPRSIRAADLLICSQLLHGAAAQHGGHRIRYFGFLGNCHRARKLALCRELLRMAPAAPADPPADYRDRYEALTGMSLRQCPYCLAGIMVVIGCIERPRVCQTVPDT